jgi:hypothetical protein
MQPHLRQLHPLLKHLRQLHPLLKHLRQLHPLLKKLHQLLQLHPLPLPPRGQLVSLSQCLHSENQ